MNGFKRGILGIGAPTLMLLGLLMTGMGSAWAEIGSLSTAINKAGRQRMLAERIVKAYALVGLRVQAGRHKKQLATAIKLFEAQLEEFKAYSSNQEIIDGLNKVEKLWGPFKKLASAPVSKDGAQALLEINDELLEVTHQIVLMLERQSGTQAGRLVNLAGRQRMLSQRLAKFYMIRAWGIAGADTLAKMKTAVDEFDVTLSTELVVSDKNTPEIQSELHKATKQWSLYRRGLKLESDSGDYIPIIMAVTSENLLKIMNKITGLYEKLPQ